MPAWGVHFNTHVRTDDPLVIHYAAAVRALASTIRGIPIPPSMQSRLHQLNIMRAVRGTTAIEGTQVSNEEVSAILKSPENVRQLPPSRSRDEQEVRNADHLMRYVEHLLQGAPYTLLTEDLIRGFQRFITDGIDYPNNVPGKYRNHPVHAQDYQAPPPEDVPGLMAEFIDWFNSGRPSAWDPVIRAIVAHFYVISIHPFADGNGRTSRGVESFLLYQGGINVRGFYSLANYYYQHRTEYVKWLDHVRFSSAPDLTPFVVFALRGLTVELEWVQQALIDEVKVISFRDLARETLADHGKMGTKTGERLLHFLLEIGTQEVAIKHLREGKHSLAYLYKGVTAKTLSRDLNLLRELDLVIVQKGKVRANVDRMDMFTVDKAPPIALAAPPREPLPNKWALP